jgi:hybrid cluster-associated redox disulfide protein
MADPIRSIDDLSLAEIMRVWPRTIRVFIDWHLHCVGCPIADFHTITDSADEHGYDREELRSAILLAIDAKPTSSAPVRGRQRSAAGGAGP